MTAFTDTRFNKAPGMPKKAAAEYENLEKLWKLRDSLVRDESRLTGELRSAVHNDASAQARASAYGFDETDKLTADIVRAEYDEAKATLAGMDGVIREQVRAWQTAVETELPAWLDQAKSEERAAVEAVVDAIKSVNAAYEDHALKAGTRFWLDSFPTRAYHQPRKFDYKDTSFQIDGINRVRGHFEKLADELASAETAEPLAESEAA